VAHYSLVPPGRYTFRVMASNNGSEWSQAALPVMLWVSPAYWQTWWFRSASVLLLGGALAGLLRFTWNRKIQQRLSLLEQQKALETERLRISRDIHDDLGARLTEILLLSDLTRRKQSDPGEMERHADKLSSAARDLVRNLDTIVWAVNPKNDSLDKLATYIYQYVEKYLEMTSIRCRFNVPDELPNCRLSSETRHNLFLVVKEALNNAVKHSGASEIGIGLQVGDSTLRISIEDNGRGFSPAASASAGNGLQNMERRMRDIGGRFELTSQPGHGTTIQVQLPIRAAGGNARISPETGSYVD
jgi:signal transduction histidine kinase